MYICASIYKVKQVKSVDTENIKTTCCCYKAETGELEKQAPQVTIAVQCLFVLQITSLSSSINLNKVSVS